MASPAISTLRVAVATRPIGCVPGGVPPDRIDLTAHGEGELEEFAVVAPFFRSA
jgi:hypothetical protein